MFFVIATIIICMMGDDDEIDIVYLCHSMLDELQLVVVDRAGVPDNRDVIMILLQDIEWWFRLLSEDVNNWRLLPFGRRILYSLRELEMDSLFHAFLEVMLFFANAHGWIRY